MRVLFTVNPAKTMFLTMAPLAWALRTAGHEVRFASQPCFADVITQAGLTALPVGRNVDILRLLEAVHAPEAYEEVPIGLPAPYDIVEKPENATWDRMLPALVEAVDAHKYENFPVINSLVDFARHWQPDLIIRDYLTYAGAIAAKACGAAHARLLGSIDVPGVTRELYLRRKAEQRPEDRIDPLADWLGSYGRKYGFEFSEDMVTGQFTIDQFPASLSLQADLNYVPMQYVPYGGPAVVPKWLWEKPERPRVALTLGLTAGEHFSAYDLDVRRVFHALGDLDIEVVATIADSVRARLRIPKNVRVVPYVPLHALAPTCAVVINHAGAGTLLTTALHGVPQLTVPWDFDEPEIARRTAAQGSALVLRPDLALGKDVRDGVLRLLHEPTFRESAEQLRDEIRALPTPNQIVPQLEELTTKHRTR